jgi:homocysteine S-methyltransferase
MTHALLKPFVDRDGVVILDGALATELERRGADLRDPLWSAKVLIENGDLIRQVHLDYFKAGADVATTASYQASLPGLVQRGLSRIQAVEVLRDSVRLAQDARAEFLELETEKDDRPRPLVAASIGCYGATLHDGSEYRGDYGLSLQQLIDWHRPRFEVLATIGPDLLACETIPTLVEAEALVRLLEESPFTSAWISFSCRDERHLSHGETFAEAVRLVESSANVIAVGVNCTPPRFVAPLLQTVAGRTSKPLIVYPNSGESWDAQRRCWIAGGDAVEWPQAARSWHRAGARLIGGCCRTTPETIRSLRVAALRGALL